MRSEWGLLFSFIGTALGSAVLPELLRLILPRPDDDAGSTPTLLSRLLGGVPESVKSDGWLEID